MIRHIVVFRFRDSVPPATRDEILIELRELPAEYPAIKGWCVGRNISDRDDTMSHAFSMDFVDEASLVSYLNSNEHGTFVSERWKPVIENRIVVSYEYESLT